MSKVSQLQKLINDINKGINSPAISDNLKVGMRKKVIDLEADLKEAEKQEADELAQKEKDAKEAEEKRVADEKVAQEKKEADEKAAIEAKEKAEAEKKARVRKQVKAVAPSPEKKVKAVKKKAKGQRKAHGKTSLKHAHVHAPKAALRGKKKAKMVSSKYPKRPQVKKHNAGRSKADLFRDRQRLALPPGRRVTKWGTVYYEKRANRSDVSRKVRLGKGGKIWEKLDFNNLEEYYDYIIQSYENGQKNQVRELYNDMSKEQKEGFFSYDRSEMGGLAYEQTKEYINKHVRKFDDGGGLGEEGIYVVNVGNIGNLRFDTMEEAEKAYNDYVAQSMSGFGKAAGENVVLFVNDEPEKEYFAPGNEEDGDEFQNGSGLEGPLTVDLIDNALTSDNFWLKPESIEAKIINEAEKQGYVRRLSESQAEWTEEGLKSLQESEGELSLPEEPSIESISEALEPHMESEEKEKLLSELKDMQKMKMSIREIVLNDGTVITGEELGIGQSVDDRTLEEKWDGTEIEGRKHFLHDHFRDWSEEEIEATAKHDFDDLDSDVRYEYELHKDSAKYKGGGKLTPSKIKSKLTGKEIQWIPSFRHKEHSRNYVIKDVDYHKNGGTGIWDYTLRFSNEAGTAIILSPEEAEKLVSTGEVQMMYMGDSTIKIMGLMKGGGKTDDVMVIELLAERFPGADDYDFTDEKVRILNSHGDEIGEITEDELTDIFNEVKGILSIGRKRTQSGAMEKWNALTPEKRRHFLYDHDRELPEAEIVKLINLKFVDLPLFYQDELREHYSMPQYKGGGKAGKPANSKRGGKAGLVKVYYNDLDLFEPPYRVLKTAPFVELPADNAEDIAEAKLDSREWDSYLIPELTGQEVIFVDEFKRGGLITGQVGDMVSEFKTNNAPYTTYRVHKYGDGKFVISATSPGWGGSFRDKAYDSKDAADKKAESLAKGMSDKGFKTRTLEDGGPVDVISLSDFKEKIKAAFKQPNKWHFIGGNVDGKNIKMKVWVGVKEIDVQIFSIDGISGQLPRNYSGKRDTLQMIMDALDRAYASIQSMKGGGSASIHVPQGDYVELISYPNGTLGVKLTAEGLEKVKEDSKGEPGSADYERGITEFNFIDYFEDIRGNSEFNYFQDAGEAGLAMFSGPVITDGYYMSESAKYGYTDKGHSDSHLWAFMGYETTDFTEKLANGEEVFFSEIKKHHYGTKFKKGGNTSDYWIQESLQHKGSLRKKAKQMGLIKGDEKLSFRDLDKLEKLGGVWAKKAQTARTLMHLHHTGRKPSFGKKKVKKEGGSVGHSIDQKHIDSLYHKAGDNIFGALELYAGELGIFNMYYGHKVDPAKKAKYDKAQSYLVSTYRKHMKSGGKPEDFLSNVYYLNVNLDERGDYSADVLNSNDESVWSIDADGVRELIEDGFLKYKPDEDLNRLSTHLADVGIIPKNTTILSSAYYEQLRSEGENPEEFAGGGGVGKLTQSKVGDTIILKRGRKTYAEISYNKNPDYKWVLYLNPKAPSGMALSGFETSEAAVKKANQINDAWNETIASISEDKFSKGGGIKSQYENFDLSSLDEFEERTYHNLVKGGGSTKEHALKVLINNVEGDYSQLSPKLAKLAIADLQKHKFARGGKSNVDNDIIHVYHKSEEEKQRILKNLDPIPYGQAFGNIQIDVQAALKETGPENLKHEFEGFGGLSWMGNINGKTANLLYWKNEETKKKVVNVARALAQNQEDTTETIDYIIEQKGKPKNQLSILSIMAKKNLAVRAYGGKMAKGGIIPSKPFTTYAFDYMKGTEGTKRDLNDAIAINVLNHFGYGIMSDALTHSTQSGIDFMIGGNSPFLNSPGLAGVASFGSYGDKDEMFSHIITKADLREMSQTARYAGVDTVILYTNRILELKSGIDKPKSYGFDRIVRVQMPFRTGGKPGKKPVFGKSKKKAGGDVMGKQEYEILEGYLEAAFWTDEDMLEGASISDLNIDSKLEADKDVLHFMKKAGHLIDDLDPSQVGQDLWLTRNGHGAGFWDRGLGETGEKLSAIAREMGEQNIYLGDDGEVYFTPSKFKTGGVLGDSITASNYKTIIEEGGRDYFSKAEIKNIIATVGEYLPKLSGSYGFDSTGGNTFHIYVQLKDKTWLGFHNASGDITLTSGKYDSLNSLSQEVWEGNEELPAIGTIYEEGDEYKAGGKPKSQKDYQGPLDWMKDWKANVDATGKNIQLLDANGRLIQETGIGRGTDETGFQWGSGEYWLVTKNEDGKISAYIKEGREKMPLDIQYLWVKKFKGGGKADAKYKVGDKVLYTPKLSGFDNSKPLVIEAVSWKPKDDFTAEGYHYVFAGSALASNEKDLTPYSVHGKRKAKMIPSKHSGGHMPSPKRYQYEGKTYSGKGLVDFVNTESFYDRADNDEPEITTVEDAILYLGLNHVKVVDGGHKMAHA